MIMNEEHVKKFRKRDSPAFQATKTAFSCRKADREAQITFIWRRWLLLSFVDYSVGDIW